NRRAAMEIWQNQTENTGHWAGIEPVLEKNTHAVGAWVELKTDAGTTVQEITVGGGHAGGKAVPVHFGLGNATTAEIRVIWPDGAVSEWTTIDVDRVTRISRDNTGLAVMP
ncbi:MAG: ASPIC/UnbV domain-containing protein, partial [Albidovulum sp.]